MVPAPDASAPAVPAPAAPAVMNYIYHTPTGQGTEPSMEVASHGLGPYRPDAECLNHLRRCLFGEADSTEPESEPTSNTPLTN